MLASSLSMVAFATIILAEARRSDRSRATADILWQLLERLPVNLQVKDIDGCYIWFNESFGRSRRENGIDPTSLIGKTIFDVASAALATAVAHQDAEAMATACPTMPLEQIFHGQDGRPNSVVSVRKIPLSRKGRNIYLATISTDSEQWRTEQARHEDVRRLLEIAMDEAPTTIQVVDRDMRLCWSNRSFRQYFDIQGDLIAGMPLSKIPRSSRFADRTIEVNQRIFDTGVAPDEFEQWLTPTASLPETCLLVRKIPIRDASGAVSRILTIGTDITALNAAHKQAETAHNFLTSILKHSPIGIQAKNTHLAIVWANDLFGKAVGRSTEELIGKRLTDLELPPDAVIRTDNIDRTVLTEKKTIQFMERWDVDNEFRHILTIKTPVINSEGNATHVVTFGVDLSTEYRLRDEIEQTRSQLQFILDNVPVGIALKNLDGRYRWANRAFENQFGVSADAMSGRSGDEIFAARPGWKVFLDGDRDILSGVEGSTSTDIETDSSDQTRLVYSVRQTAFRTDNGRIDGVLTVSVDITNLTRIRVQLQEAAVQLESRVAQRTAELRDINRFMETVLKNTPNPIVACDFSGTIMSFSQSAISLSKDHEISVGLDLKKLLGSGAEIFERMVSVATEGGSISNMEVTIPRNGGFASYFLVSCAPLIAPDGGIDGLVSNWLDITDRRLLEAERDRWADAISNAAFGIAILSAPDIECIAANPAYLAIFGVGWEFVVSRSADACLDSESRPTFAGLIEDARATGTTSGVLALVRPDGNMASIQLWVTAVRSTDGHLLYYICSAFDITERIRIEKELRFAQKMEMLGRLTGGIAHDFNNMLSIVIGNTDCMMEGETPSADTDAMLKDTLEAALKASELCRKLMTFASQQPLEPTCVDIGMTLFDLERLLSRLLGDNIELTVEVPPNLWTVMVDRTMLQSALVNLALNGRDAMPNGGNLHIEARNASWPAGRVGSNATVPPGDYVVVSVRDTGSGIPREIVDRVFEPFFSTKGSKGNGLGLSMVHGFIGQSGGHILLESTPGVGTEIALCLIGTAAQPEVNSEPPDSGTHFESAGECILVVEDDISVRRILARRLLRLRYRVLEAGNAREALDILRLDSEIDVLLTDIDMPGPMNGIELSKLARQRHPELKVMVTSGVPSLLEIVSRDPNPAHDILYKPYTLHLLRDRLGDLLRNRSRPESQIPAIQE